MATRKKAKGKAKRKKTRVINAAKRKKATTVRKTKTTRKKPAKKAPLKAGPSAKIAIRPTPNSPPAQPEAVRATPSAQPPPAEQGERVGVVTHYYSHLAVAIIRLESGRLRVGDAIHIRGHTTDFIQKVESLEVNHAPVSEVGPNEEFGLKVVEHAREHDVLFKVRS